jgi:hypothetical protein
MKKGLAMVPFSDRLNLSGGYLHLRLLVFVNYWCFSFHQPLLWEWVWLLSVPVTFFGLSACKKSSLIAIRRYQYLVLRYHTQPSFAIVTITVTMCHLTHVIDNKYVL